jgi:imidazolonepropionase-like amidohydrolase
MAVQTAHAYGRKVNAHVRSAQGIKDCVRAGVDGLFHCEFADEEALDMMEAAKDRIFVTPTPGLFKTVMNNEAAASGLSAEVGIYMGVDKVVENSIRTHNELRKRGVRMLIGGDYGFAWSPQGTQARDLEFFVEDFGFGNEAALICATRNGGLAMRDEGDLGTLAEGSLADMLLVDGNPLDDVRIMTDHDRLVMIMKDGQVHKNATQAVKRRATA